MGQRTQIVLQTVDLEGISKTKIYHEQWGYARTMPNLLMELVISTMYGTRNRVGISTKKTIHDITMDSWDITNEFDYVGQVNLNDVEQVKNVLKGSDNNNGYMVVQLAQYKDENHYLFPQTKITVKFMRGLEECPNSYYDRYSKKKLEEWEFKYVSFDKYCKPFTYCDKDFKKLFKNFCKYYDVSIDVDTKFVEPNLQNNIEQALLNDSEVVKEVTKSIV